LSNLNCFDIRRKLFERLHVTKNTNLSEVSRVPQCIKLTPKRTRKIYQNMNLNYNLIFKPMRCCCAPAANMGP